MDYLTQQQESLQVSAPASCTAGSGAGWIGSAWGLFKSSWLEFLVAFVLLFVIRFAVEQLPIIGFIISALLMPLLVAGFLEIAHRAHNDNEPSIGNLFAAFASDKREQMTKLLQLGALSLLFSVVLVVLLGVALVQSMGGLDALMELLKLGNSLTPQQFLGSFHASPALLIWLLGFALLLVLYSCAIWFATPLLWFTDKRLFDAVQLSLAACKRNALPLTVLALLALLLALLALIPFGLGLLVLVPVLMITSYTSFRQIFVDGDHKM